jgi:hypothetical protein
MPSSVMVGWQHLRGLCCLCLQGEMTGNGKKWCRCWAQSGLYLCHSGHISMPFFPIAPHFTLKMYMALTSETLVSYHNTAWCHNPEHLNLNLHCPGSLKFKPLFKFPCNSYSSYCYRLYVLLCYAVCISSKYSD